MNRLHFCSQSCHLWKNAKIIAASTRIVYVLVKWIGTHRIFSVVCYGNDFVRSKIASVWACVPTDKRQTTRCQPMCRSGSRSLSAASQFRQPNSQYKAAPYCVRTQYSKQSIDKIWLRVLHFAWVSISLTSPYNLHAFYCPSDTTRPSIVYRKSNRDLKL